MTETATTTDVTELLSPDTSITKTEKFNASRVAQLLTNSGVGADDKRILRGIKSGSHNLCYFNATYKLGKAVKIQNLGRYYPLRGIGAQALSRDVRSAVFGEFYHDVDISNAQPTILLQYCKANNYKCDALIEYVERRDECMREVMEFMGCDRTEAKQRIHQIIFGGSADGMPDFFATTFYNELKAIRQNVWDKNKDLFKNLAKKPNFLMSAMAHVLQTEETKCLLAMDKSFAKHGYSMDVLIHDGGLVARRGDEMPDEILQKVEVDVKTLTGYEVKLAVKPMNTTIEFQDERDEYTAWKTEFEKTHFRIQIPQCFVWVHDEGFELLSQPQLAHNEGQARMSNGKTFLSAWLDDENMLTYEKLAFAPKTTVPAKRYNIFDGFANIPAEGDFSAFTELVGLVSSHDEKTETYLHNLFAHMVQKPYEKSGVCVCFIGDQGVGKSLINQKVGKIFGPSYFYETSAPENDVFNIFNSGTERTIMLFMDEVDFKTNKTNAPKLKTLISSPKAWYRKKGHDGVELDDYRNVFMATNHRLPFVVEDTDRRMVAIECSNERMGQYEWWGELVKKLDAQVSAYHFHLLHRDISAFQPQRDRPITQAYNDIKQMTSIPYHAGFFQKVITDILMKAELFESTEISTKEWKAVDLHAEMSEYLGDRFELSTTKLGLDMRRIYDKVGGVDKQIGKFFATYTLSPHKCMEFLKSKNWWVE